MWVFVTVEGDCLVNAVGKLCSERDGDLVKVSKARFLARPQESQFAFVLGGEEVEDVVDVDPHFGRLAVDNVDVNWRQAVRG